LRLSAYSKRSLTFSGSGSRVIDAFSLHAPLPVSTRSADVGALFRLRVADLLVGDPALHRVAHLLLQNSTLSKHTNQDTFALPNGRNSDDCGFADLRIISVHLVKMQTGGTGSSNRPWLSRQTGPISSGVTRNSGAPTQNIQIEPSLLS